MGVMRRRERRFTHAAFGPWRLRPLLRAMLERDERLIGWGVVQPAGGAWSKLSTAMITVVPVVGPIVGAVTTTNEARRRRVAVLTSRRLLMMRADARRLDETMVAFNEPLELLEFESRGAGSGQEPTILVHFGAERPAMVEVVGGSARSVDRLREGLLALCGHDEPM
ncbi:MAG: hypothetical protein KDB18_07760 [Salinibacterium sp.]|nr:hypothetical protein [Salinibacterium sp.]